MTNTQQVSAKNFDLNVLTTLTVERKPRQDGRFGFTCIKATQGDTVLLAFTARPADIFPLFTVPRCDGNSGYQRELSEKRAQAIAAYLRHNPIPGSISISLRDCANPKYDPKSKMLSFDNVPGSLCLLDGQHRVFGGSLEGSAQFIFVAILGLDEATEAGIFLDINGLQKGVPATLASKVRGIAGRENSTERTISVLFDQFQANEDSALSGRLSALEARGGHISHLGFMRGMKPVMRIAQIRGYDPSTRYTLMNRVFKHLLEVIGDDFFRSVVFGGVLANTERILSRATQLGGNLKDNAIALAVEPLKNFNKENATTGTRLSKTDVANHVAELLGDTAAFGEV